MSKPTGLVLPPNYVSALPWYSGYRYDASSIGGGGITTAALVANSLYALPIVPVSLSRVYGSPVAVNEIAIEVTTGAAAKTARLGIYTVGSDGRPGSLVVDAGEVDVTNIAGVGKSLSLSLSCGVPVFLAIVCDGTPTLRALSNLGMQAGAPGATENLIKPAWVASLTYTAGVTAMPSTFTTTGLVPSSVCPRITLKAA